MEVAYTEPGLTALGGCLTDGPYPSSGCALVKTSGPNTKLFVQGTVYAPTAALDIGMANVSAPVFGRGVVARSLRLSVKPAPCYSGPVAAVLDDAVAAAGPGSVFTACIEGTPRLRARVFFPTGSPPPPPKIQSWSVLR